MRSLQLLVVNFWNTLPADVVIIIAGAPHSSKHSIMYCMNIVNHIVHIIEVQYRSFITSLLHACTCMAPRSIWRVKILGLPWKKFFPRDESWHLAWHFTTRVLAFPRHVSFPQDVDFHVTSHDIYTQRA